MKAIVLFFYLMTGTAGLAMAKDHEVYKEASSGTFAPVGEKHTEGDVYIKQIDGVNHLVFGSNFKTDNGPDLRVVLRDSTGQTTMEIVEHLKSFEGEQSYKLPLDKHALSAFDQVVIYCLEFHVDFGIASLN